MSELYEREPPVEVPPPPRRDRVRRLRARLLAWYRANRRDLPWRGSDDPYAIWVSEIMLQQTQVATVIPYFERFIERFPDVRRLAAAELDDVLAAWSGLGYYRRARSLHAGALAVVERHDGRIPDSLEALLALPGVGRYTAGAIASIAFDRPAPILDGNVRRVLSRLFAIDASTLSRSEEERKLWSLAERFADGPAPGDVNQALMELGALICTPSAPACGDCPWSRSCAGRAEPGRYPVVRPKPPTTRVQVASAWIVRGDEILLEAADDSNPLRGRWELPSVVVGPGDEAEALLARRVAIRHGIKLKVGPWLGSERHGVMQRRLAIDVYRCGVGRAHCEPTGGDARWFALTELDRAAVSGATLKIARLAARA